MVVQQETTTTTQWEMTHEQLSLDPSFDPTITNPGFDPDDPATWPEEWQPPITIQPIGDPVLLDVPEIVHIPRTETNSYTFTIPVVQQEVTVPSSGSLPVDIGVGAGATIGVALVIHFGKKLIDLLFEKI